MVLGQTFGGGNLYFIALWSDVANPGGSLATSWCHVAWVLLRQYFANEHCIEGAVMQFVSLHAHILICQNRYSLMGFTKNHSAKSGFKFAMMFRGCLCSNAVCCFDAAGANAELQAVNATCLKVCELLAFAGDVGVAAGVGSV
jgi:hypothetical protein